MSNVRQMVAGILCGATLLCSGCHDSKFAAVSTERLLAANEVENSGQWMSYGRDYAEQRFSPLKRINTDTVKDLGLAWFADFDTRRGQESTPLAIDGVLYVSTAWSKIYAFEAKSGRQLWKFDPQVPGEWGVNACCDVSNRGVAAWNGKIYIGTIDGRLIAVDAASGKPVWDVSTIDRNQRYSITGAPRVVKGLVLIGNSGADFGVRGYVSAYDAQTGKMVWRWYTVPGNPNEPFENPQMESAAKTWGGEWWKLGGGGTVWDAITYDPKTDLLFIGTGNGGPWPAESRDPGGTGDHLFLTSIVALRPDTGQYVWHYQEVQRDSWDYTAVQQITVADLKINGADRHVVMQAPKNGYFYVLDAASGELISAQPIVPLNWSTGIDSKTGRPIMNPAARYDVTGKGFTVMPFFGGAHNWHPMSFSLRTGLVYIPTSAMDFPFVFAAGGEGNPMGQQLALDFARSAEMQRDPSKPRVNQGYLLAWDPVRQKEAWRVPYGSDRSGGTLSTAGGLVFAGNLNGKELVAYRDDTGERLWSQGAQTGVMAGPATFEVDGEQFIAVVAGQRASNNYWASNYSRLLVYKLGGTAKLPDAAPETPLVLNPPAAFGTPEMIAHGRVIYERFCGTCHGIEGFNRGRFPDLRYAGALHSASAFRAIVIDGALAKNGMVSFAKVLKPDEPESLRAYLTARAIELKNASPAQAPSTAAPDAH